MDLYCTRCGEPWDMDYVQFEMTPQERNHFRHGEGCPACEGKEICRLATKCGECQEYSEAESRCRLGKLKRPFRAQVAATLGDILGDDLDGLAAEMEDLGSLLND